MQPIVNNFTPPKPADLNTLSQDQNNTDSNSGAQLPNGMTEQAVLAYAKGRNSTWDSWFTPKFKLIEDNRKMWRNVGSEQRSSGTNKPIPLAVAYSIVESVAAKMNITILGRPKMAEAVSDSPQQDNNLQETVEDFVNQSLTAQIRKPEIGKAAIKCALLDGFTIVRSTWKRTPIESAKTSYEKDPHTGENLFMGQAAQQGFKEEWVPVKKNAGNCAWDIHTTTKVQDSEWFRERARISYNELLRWHQEGRIKSIDGIKNIVPSGLAGSQKEDFEAKLKKADGDDKWTLTYADEKVYQIDEWYAYMTYTDKSAEENAQVKTIKAHFFIVEGEKLIQFEKNDLLPCRHPYISGVAIQDPDSVIGLSLIEAIKPLLEAINTYAGKQQSLVEWCSNPTIFYGVKSGLSGRTTFSRPMGMQPVSDASDIKEFLGNPSSVKVVQEYIQWLISRAQETSGANEQFQGMEGSNTATEFAGLQAAAGSRFQDEGDTLNQGLIENLAQECYWFYRQFGVDGQMVVHPQTEESAAKPLTKADLQGEYRFVATSSATDSYKGKQVQDDTAFVGEMVTANQSGIFAPLMYNLPKHITDISLPLRGQKSSKDMFTQAPVPPPPPPPHPEPPRVSVALNGQDIVALGLAGPIMADFGAQQMPPQGQPMDQGTTGAPQ